ncbi:MAG: dihydroneopterin aldolase [Selenomonadaceae bacterium]|nr:dihydroneopterin aldolase [Selenomonadaceae bacterium]
MVKVRIANMMFYGFHGYYEYEREQGQKFFFDVELMMEDDKAADTDSLNDGVDTARVYDIVKEVTENKRFQLLAALAGHIADRLLAKFPHIDEASVRVRKPSVPIAGPIDYVEVEVIRKQKKE